MNKCKIDTEVKRYEDVCEKRKRNERDGKELNTHWKETCEHKLKLFKFGIIEMVDEDH